MSENQPDVTPAPVVNAAPAPTIFSTKTPSSVVFAIGVLLFLLPFLDIRCNNISLQKVTGAELATGFHIKGPGSNNSLLGNFQDMSNDDVKVSNKGNKKDPNPYALAALGLGVMGFVLSIANARTNGMGGLLAGSLAAASLIGLMIDIKRQVKTDIDFQQTGQDVSIGVEFTPMFYCCLLAFIAGAYFSYRRLKSK